MAAVAGSPRKRRRKIDQYLRGVRDDPEVVLQEMTNLSNNLFRLLVGIIFTVVLIILINPMRWTSGWPAAFGVTLFLVLANGLGWLLLLKVQRKGLDRPAGFNQLVFTIIFTLLISEFILTIHGSPFLAPVPMFAMVMALIFGQPVAFFLVMGMGLYLGLMSPGGALPGSSQHIDLVVTLALSMGGIASVLGMSRVRQQSWPVVVGANAGMVQALVVLVFALIQGKPGTREPFSFRDLNSQQELGQFLQDPFLALLGGLISGAVVTCFLPVLERFFGIVTERRLLALTDPNNKLLQALRNRAPGTYTHTLRVADLAGEAAEAIGADPLLSRVGAYFHDIGKIAKPEYFVENKESNLNIHDRLRPSMSKLIIISHVKEGVELAEEARLPRKIVDMIPMHHGTTVVEYFYHKAKVEGDLVKTEVEYRYPGPRPRFREAGILMLADGVEAAAKSIAEPNPARFRTIVHDLVLKKLLDHQLDESDLTMRDLTRIEESFVRTLTFMYHGRIKYPGGDSSAPPGRTPAAAPGRDKAANGAPEAGPSGKGAPAPPTGPSHENPENLLDQSAEVPSPGLREPAKDPVHDPPGA